MNSRLGEAAPTRDDSEAVALLSPVAVSRRADMVYDELFRKITSGVFPSGFRLPGELALSRQFSVSRPVVRQALEQLRASGLIISRQGSGSYVSGFGAADLDAVDRDKQISRLLACYEFRLAVEPAIAALAAKRINRAHLHRIEHMLQEDRTSLESNNVGVDADYNFHLSIAQAAENEFLIKTLELAEHEIKLNTFAVRKLRRNASDHLGVVVEEHRAIIEAIARRNVEGAREQMRVHLENSRAFLLDVHVAFFRRADEPDPGRRADQG
jgi:GntR family transcriptional repressor for pyruvate dehydrogenase complex